MFKITTKDTISSLERLYINNLFQIEDQHCIQHLSKGTVLFFEDSEYKNCYRWENDRLQQSGRYHIKETLHRIVAKL